jgi:hypothetical protein
MNKMAGHTPGPWVIGRRGKRNVYSSSVATPICMCDSMQESSLEEEQANARLIAAAPDLLEALKRCRFDSLNMSMADLEFCRAAYLKAIGE